MKRAIFTTTLLSMLLAMTAVADGPSVNSAIFAGNVIEAEERPEFLSETTASSVSEGSATAGDSVLAQTGVNSSEEASAADGVSSDTGLNSEDATIANLLKNSKTAESNEQILLLVDHNFSLWNKDENGNFTKQMESYAGYGRNGLRKAEERQEGDGTTPIGSFPVLFAFGQHESANTNITYRPITQNSYWSGEVSTYNTWVESETRIAGEKLSEYTICYEYALALGFNIDPVVYGRGSAIFLHIKDPAKWESSGCISLEREQVLQLYSLMKEESAMIIVSEAGDIANY